MKTLEFPPKHQLLAGTESSRERGRYLDGLAVLQEVAAVSETFSPANWDAAVEISTSPNRLPNLGAHLKQCAVKLVEATNSQHREGSTVTLEKVVPTLHLRESMRERLIDIAVQISAHTHDDLAEIYDADELKLNALDRDVRSMRLHDFPDEVIARTLGVPNLPTTTDARQTTAYLSPSLPHYPQNNSSLYQHTNSRGISYYLHKTEVTLRGGRPQPIYFFAKVPLNEKGEPVPLPPDRVVRENPRNGFLTVSKKK